MAKRHGHDRTLLQRFAMYKMREANARFIDPRQRTRACKHKEHARRYWEIGIIEPWVNGIFLEKILKPLSLRMIHTQLKLLM
jgi:hypothetical protein